MINLRKIGSFSALLSLSCFASACFPTPPPELETEGSNLRSYRIEPNFRKITAIDFAPDKNLLLVTGEKEFSEEPKNGAVEIWDINERRLIQTLETDIGNNLESAFTSNGAEEILVIDTSGEIALWDLSSGEKESIVMEGSGEKGSQRTYSLNSDFSQSQQILARGSYLGPLTLLDIRTGEESELYSLENSEYAWGTMKFSHNGKYLTARTYPKHTAESDHDERVIYIFNVQKQELILSIDVSRDISGSGTFIGDDLLMLTGRDGVLEVRNIETGDVVQDLSIETSFDHRKIEVIPETNFIAVTSIWSNSLYTVIGLVTLWDLDSGEPLCSTDRMVDTAYVNVHFAVSPDGKKLVTNEDNTLIIWDIEDCLSL
jgi:hypothetical protein